MWLRFSPIWDVLLSVTLGACLAAGCSQSTSPSTRVVEEKSEASPDGLAAAQRDIRLMKVRLREMTPEQLIAAFVPDGPKRYGSYDYYFNYMTNIAVREELESRGAAARRVLQQHQEDSTRIWEAANGPGDTIGHVCTQLLDSLAERPQPAT